MKVLKWLDNNLEKTICIILMSTMTSIIFIQFVSRRGFNNSLPWSEELARYIFIWLIYIGISYGAKMKQHIRLEMGIIALPKKVQPFFFIFAELLFLAFAVLIIVTSWEVFQRQIFLGQTSPAMRIPMSWVYFAPTVGFSLTAFRQIQVIIERIKALKADKGKGG